MFKILFKKLLAVNYSTARWLVNKKMPERIIPSTLHFFATPFTFIAAGLYFVLIGTIEYKFDSFLPIFIGMAIIMLVLGYFLETWAKKAIFRWKIEKEYSKLNRKQRIQRNFFAFCFFWAGLVLFFYLGIKYFGGYSFK